MKTFGQGAKIHFSPFGRSIFISLRRDVAILGSNTVSVMCKIEQVTSRMASIGLHLPHEQGAWRNILSTCISMGLNARSPQEQLSLLNDLKRGLRLKLRGVPQPEPFLSEFPNNPPDSLISSAYSEDDPPTSVPQVQPDGVNKDLVLRKSSKLLKATAVDAVASQANPQQALAGMMHQFMVTMMHSLGGGGQSAGSEIPSLQILAPQTKAKQATKATEVQRQATPQAALADAAQNDQVTQAALPTQQADQQKEQQATASPFTLPKVPSTTMEPEEQAALVEQAMRNREANKKAAGKAKAKAKSKAKAKAKSLNTKPGPKCKATAKSVAKATAKPEARQKSTGKVIQKIEVGGKTFSEACRRKYYPEGCSKCRWTAGCTPSCFKDRKVRS